MLDPVTLLIRQLREQRSRGLFCSLKLSVGRHTTWAHAAVICPISEFINNLYESNKPYAKVDLTGLIPQDCFTCLEQLLDIIYGLEITVENQHSSHIISYFQLLQLPDVYSSIISKNENNIKLSDEKPMKLEILDHEMQNDFDKDDEKPMKLEMLNHEMQNDFDKDRECDVQSGDSEDNQIADRNENLKSEPERKLKRAQRCVGCRFKCFKTFDLLNHLQETGHGGKVCSLCWIELDDTNDLKIHLTLHNHPKPFYCIYCNSRFRTKSSLTQHLPGHTCEKPHTCPHCQKAFKRKSGLNSHLIVHSKEHKHLCDECGFRTNHARILRAHKLTHTGDFFKCSFPNCSHRTSRKENMKQHLKTHSNERPFICELCGHKFTQKKSLRRHLIMHSNQNLNNICPHCPFKTRRDDNLKAHISRQHAMILTNFGLKTKKTLETETCVENIPTVIDLKQDTTSK